MDRTEYKGNTNAREVINETSLGHWHTRLNYASCINRAVHIIQPSDFPSVRAVFLNHLEGIEIVKRLRPRTTIIHRRTVSDRVAKRDRIVLRSNATLLKNIYFVMRLLRDTSHTTPSCNRISLRWLVSPRRTRHRVHPFLSALETLDTGMVHGSSSLLSSEREREREG